MKKVLLIALLFLYAFSYTAFATLTTPSLVSPSSGSTGNAADVILDWGAVTNATGYEYKVSLNPGLTGATIQTVTGTSQASTSSLLFGTTYYWQVRAIKTTVPIDSSAWSTIWSFTTLDIITLVSPTSGNANQSADVILDWSPTTGITYYDYQWDTTASFNSPLNIYGSIAAGTSQITSFNLRFGTKYYWRARARHANDTTQWSAVWNFTTLDIITLVSPTNGSTNQAPDAILDWSPTTGITYYDYQWDTTASFNSSLSNYGSIAVGTSQITSSSLLFGTKYYWRARARHTTDTTQWSAVWNFTTLDIVTLVSPVSGAANQSADVILDWSPVTGITFYDYEWDTTASFNSSLNHYGSIAFGTSQVTSSNLLFGTKYYWHTRARHATDTTQWSAVWNFTTLDVISLVSPTNSATNQTPDVILDWSPTTGITYYDYEWDTTASFNSPQNHYGSVAVGSSQISSSNLLFGTKYYWRARARHTTDTTQWSAIWNFTTLDYVTHVSPANNSTGISLNPVIDWSPITGITTYQYQYDTDPGFANPNIYSVGSGSSQASLLNLSYGTKYYWRVRVAHTADTSMWSNAWNFTTIYQITSAPTLISPANYSFSIPVTGTILEWSSVANATFYEILYDDDSTFATPVTASVAALTTSTGSLLADTTYFWKVRGGNGSGYSPWSETWRFSTEMITSLNVNETDITLNVFPNPCSDILTLSTTSQFKLGNILLLDISGRIVYTTDVSASYVNIDVSSYQNGNYFLIMNNRGNKRTIPVMISR